jgi:hypothetical protein
MGQRGGLVGLIEGCERNAQRQLPIKWSRRLLTSERIIAVA